MLSLSLGLGLSQRGGGGGLSAALALDFTTGSLDSRITFTRASLATVVDSTGKVTYAPSNTALHSASVASTSFLNISVGVTRSADQVTAPDGSSNGDMLTEDTANSRHFAVNTTGVAVTPSTVYILSCYFKAGTNNYAHINASSASGTSTRFGAVFDLSDGSLGNTDSTGSPSGSSSIVDVGGGWYRCAIKFTTASDNTTIQVGFGMSDSKTPTWSSNSPSYIGTSKTIYVWGTQLEAVTYQTTPGTYIPTTTAAVYGPRFDHDPVTLAPLGLLIEEQRTNLLTYSEQFNNAAWAKTNATITANAVTAPDGTTTADKLVEASDTAQLHSTNIGTSTLMNGVYSKTVYLKAAERSWALVNFAVVNGTYSLSDPRAWFDLVNGVVGTVANGTASISPAGNGWYRCTLVSGTYSSANRKVLVATATGDGVTSHNGDGTSGIYVWGAQLEAGAFATSYIPTVASTVTRSADVASMTGTNFSDWYNQPEGTFVSSAGGYTGASTVSFVGHASDNTTNEYVDLGRYQPNLRVIIADGGVIQANFGGTGNADGTIRNVAVAYKVNDFAMVQDGGTPLTDTSGTVPTPNRLWIGSDGQAVRSLNGRIKSISYYNTRLPDATLQELTA